jgi:hypothetical protein
MPPVALPTINQGALPPGVPGQSRDDLVLGFPVVVSDAGPGPTRAWQLLDKPDGSAAVLSSGSGPSTQFTPDIEGTYRIQLIVNGGPTDDHIAYVGAGVQIDLPTWVVGDGQKVRIPAWGERLDFNVKSSPGSGVNTRGWAYEVNQFFRVIAKQGFGFLVKLSGAPVGSQPFKTINFLGGTAVDAGGGQLDYTPSGGGPSNQLLYTGSTGVVGPTEIYIGGVPGSRKSLSGPNTVLMCESMVVCKNNGGTLIAAWRIMGAWRRDGFGNATLINQVKEVLANELAVDFNYGATGGDIQLLATGLGATLHWSAQLAFVENNIVI